ncbi:hypothetical protein ZHAS_00015823 [Anopheles sinensis]|uniref:Uncharacterized protein n=1 Tax=Anopheles sinensis TaxID=74873 RepID=A0A084WC10_ANOSI|nr:hypothetical protein ZHAS_00015823 [Anopheles sinensis]
MFFPSHAIAEPAITEALKRLIIGLRLASIGGRRETRGWGEGRLTGRRLRYRCGTVFPAPPASHHHPASSVPFYVMILTQHSDEPASALASDYHTVFRAGEGQCRTGFKEVPTAWDDKSTGTTTRERKVFFLRTGRLLGKGVARWNYFTTGS